MTNERSLLGLPAPAKLNLFLHVTGRRPDGKHLLQSIFTLIDLADTVDLTLINVRQRDVVAEQKRKAISIILKIELYLFICKTYNCAIIFICRYIH